MFGYVKPNRDEMKVKEYRTYQAIYCGLCKCMGKCVSCSARFTLSYDFVFLALLRIGLCKEKVSFGQGRCLAHPFKKKVYVKANNSLAFCAKASTLLSYYQIEDHCFDHKGLSRWKYRILLTLSKGMLRKVKDLGELQARMAQHLGVLHQVEASHSTSVDAPAETFGCLLGETAAFGLPNNTGRIAYEICFHIGKWIYFADALDDWEKDRQSGSYNPLLTCGLAPEKAAEILTGAMARERTAAKRAFDLIDFDDVGIHSMLVNILEEGLPMVERKILSKMEKQNDESL